MPGPLRAGDRTAYGAGVLLVLWIVLSVVGVLLLVGLGVLLFLRGRVRRADAAVATLLADEPALHGPEPAAYNGSTGSGLPRVQGNGRLALTARRLVFVPLVGKGHEIAVPAIVTVEERTWFRTGATLGRRHLVVATGEAEAGYYVADNAAWVAAVVHARDAGQGHESRADGV